MEARAAVLRGSGRDADAYREDSRSAHRPCRRLRRRARLRRCRQGRRWKAISRHIAYHGTTMGALSINGIPALRIPFEPLVPDVLHVRNTNRYHRPPEETEAQFTAFLLDDLEHTIEAAGPETVAMVIMEPVQNAGGAFTPPEGYWRGVRELCDRYDILLCADEVITGFGRVGAWFGSERYDIRPDLMTIAKGLSSSYAAIGAVVASDRVMEPFMQDTSMYSHGITFGGHPVMSAIALKNIEIMKRERIVEHVAETQDHFHQTLSQLLELPIVGDVRGTGFFYAIELVKDKETRESFDDKECETLLRDFLSPQLFERGLICRADDRGDPVIQISPPLDRRASGVRPDRLDSRRHARRGLEASAHMTAAGERGAAQVVSRRASRHSPRRGDQEVRRRRCRRRAQPRDRARQLLRHARALRLRQDDDAADDRRLRATDGGADLPRRRGGQRPSFVQAGRQHGLPVVRALSAPHHLRERRLRPASPRDSRADT